LSGHFRLIRELPAGTSFLKKLITIAEFVFIVAPPIQFNIVVRPSSVKLKGDFQRPFCFRKNSANAKACAELMRGPEFSPFLRFERARTMAKWIIARATSGKCEGSEFVFDLIESAIRKETTEILLTPVQESEMVRVDFGRLHCYYRQPKITRAQFAYLAIYLVLIGNVAAEEAPTERLFRGSDERLYNLQFGKIRLPDSEPAVVIYIEPLRPTTTARGKK
jgi:hypothetical protein